MAETKPGTPILRADATDDHLDEDSPLHDDPESAPDGEAPAVKRTEPIIISGVYHGEREVKDQ